MVATKSLFAPSFPAALSIKLGRRSASPILMIGACIDLMTLQLFEHLRQCRIIQNDGVGPQTYLSHRLTIGSIFRGSPMTRRERQFIIMAPVLLALVMLFTFAQWMGWITAP